MQSKQAKFLNLAVLLAMVVSLMIGPAGVQNVRAAPVESGLHNLTAQTLPFSQDWTDPTLITVNDDWSLVPGVMGYIGDFYPSSYPTDLNAQNVLTMPDTLQVDVIANQTAPNVSTSGGVAEFAITNPVVALQGSSTADAPFILLNVATIGKQNIHISYNVRDIDGSTLDNSVQQVALHYRVGTTVDFTNVPEAYIPDATTGPGIATLVTPISVDLPASVNNQPLVQIRILTTNAPGGDEWVGIDDILITGEDMPMDPRPVVIGTDPLDNATQVAVDSNVTVNFSEEVTATDAFAMVCGPENTTVSFAVANTGPAYTLNPDDNLPFYTSCTVTITAANVSDLDEPIETMETDYTWSFTTARDPDVIVPIADAREAGAGFTGWIQGNVTTPPGIFNRAITIQDATGGMYVYAGSLTLPELSQGDLVKVRGTIKLFNGMLETDPTYEVVPLGSGTAPAPEVMTTASVPANQGKLVNVTGTVTWTGTPPAPGASNFTFSINDGSGPINVFINKATGLDMTGFASGQTMRVVGISGAYNTPQILPRFQADLVDLRPPVVTGTTPANGAADVSLYRPVSVVFSKRINPDSLTANFTLSGPADALSGAVSYDDATKTATFTPGAPLEPQTTYTGNLTTGVQDLIGIPLEAEYNWSFTTGDADTTAPVIVTRTPDTGAVDVPVSTKVMITYSEELAAGSQSESHFSLTGPYGAVPVNFSFDPATYTVTLAPQGNLLPTSTFTVTVDGSTADLAGNPMGEDVSWSFSTAVEPPMQAFFGDLHNHTGYSDGSGTPAQALAAGKSAGFDFMAISDHSYAIDDAEWANTLTAVNDATTADFVGLRGFEYTQGAEGHINVWNSVRHAVRTDTGCTYCDYTPNLEAGSTVSGFYPWLVSPSAAALDGAGIVMQFNHPGWINFNDWFYHPEVSNVARLEEVGNGSGTSYVFSEDQYIRSLDYGWKVGATNNADTHSAYWGVNTDDRTGVLMPELTKAALLEALNLRRTFASEDKNFSLSMKANGAWMGSEINNTGQIQFEIQGNDPDGELASKVELITDQGEVVDTYLPAEASFTWSPLETITTGVHYYYVKVTQVDGNRIVTSPVWTMGTEDISITDITIQPTIPTIYSPSLITVRVTNRAEEERTVNVVVKVNGADLAAAKPVVVPANGDGYVNFDWQPAETGAAAVTAEILDAPAGDNPDDNSDMLELTVSDAHLPLILIDAGHGNMNAEGNEMKAFIDDLSAHHFNVLKNLDALTEADLNPDVVKLLIITAPETAYTEAERTAIGNFINAGGSLWLGGLADYTGSVAWAATVADRENAILDSIETATGQLINMRMNDDEVIDADDNNGYVFGVIWGDFPAKDTTGIGLNVEKVSTWSLSSIRGRTINDPLTSTTPGVQIVMQGDLDEGYGPSPYYNPNHTSNENADDLNDAYIYNPTWVYSAAQPADAIPVPGAAVTDLEGTAGRIMLYGDSNDPFTTFAYTAGDGKQNELFNLQSIMWLLGSPITKSTVAEARAQAVEDQPDNLGKLVWVEGEITAAYGEFFNVLYLRDETGGITVHAPAGDIDATNFTRGTKVRAIGTVGIYNGDTEIEFFEAEMVQVLEPSAGEPTPEPFTTHQAALEANEGRLVEVTGKIISKVGTDTLMITDGTGVVRVFLDGYNGSFEDIPLDSRVRVIGLASEDGDGPRIRVRNYKMHVEYADDVVQLDSIIYLPLLMQGKMVEEH